jgi:hypothetical protein
VAATREATSTHMPPSHTSLRVMMSRAGAVGPFVVCVGSQCCWVQCFGCGSS